MQAAVGGGGSEKYINFYKTSLNQYITYLFIVPTYILMAVASEIVHDR